jgi:peptidoglycan/xylan/chitin deacetylase (PgdA/CDA1 family)
MYHKITNTNEPYNIQAFKEHLHYLQYNYPIILPGEPINKKTINICLTFDDAYFDFYHHVFPLLQQQKIRAVLGIPANFIQDTTNTASKDRLAIPYPHGLDESNQPSAPLCTWNEIQEMIASGYVMAASHGFNHMNLSKKNVNLTQELQGSKTILEKKLQTEINTIIYPFGKTSSAVNKLSKQHYTFLMRIGTASNIDWQTRDGLLYRINADELWKQNKPITSNLIRKIQSKYWLNYLRNK